MTETTTPRQLVARARRSHLHPELKARGFRAKGQRSWHRRYDDGGWVVVELVPDKWNTSGRGEWRVEVAAWPAGTWEWQSRAMPPGALPWTAIPCPAEIGTDDVPEGADATPVIRLDADLPDEALSVAATRLTAWTLRAVEQAESLLDPVVAAVRMRPLYTVIALRHVAPREPDALAGALDRLTAGFQRDPRPADLAPTIRRWRAEAGLPEVPLPGWWHGQMLAAGRRYGSPRRAFANGFGSADARTADGGRMPIHADLLPDAEQLGRWRAERVAAPVGEGVLAEPPEWLVWSRWLDAEPPDQDAASPRPGVRVPWWRRLVRRT